MSERRPAPHRDDHPLRSGDPRPLGPRPGGRGRAVAEKLEACDELEQFRRARQNLYERVRASLFLHALYRYEIQDGPAIRGTGLIPFSGFMDLMERRYEQAIATFLETMQPRRAQRRDLSARWRRPTSRSPSRPWPTRCADRSGAARATAGCSGSAGSTSIRCGSIPGCSSASRTRRSFPILVERTPVRLDLSHSGWSDIFFLGMDFPEGARVLNISVDLGVHGRDDAPVPPIESPAAGDHRADPAPDQHRPERLQGRRQPGRAVQLRQRLPGPGQGGGRRLGPGPPCPRGDAQPARRPAGPDRPAGPWAGDRQQGQRHSQGLAAGRLDQPAGLADRPLDAGDRPGAQPDRPARPRGGQGRRGPGHPGRMAGRLRRRLAGLGRDLSRHQADRGRRGRRGRSRVGRQPGPAAAGPQPAEPARPPRHRPVPTPASPTRSPRRSPRAWSWFTAAWPRTSARSSTWSPPSTCSAAATSGRRGSEALEIFDGIVASRRRRGRPRPRPADDPELGRAAQADHPLGHQRSSPSRSSARPARPWATTSGGS